MAKQESIHFVVVTPEREVLQASTDSVVVPAHDGELGILPGRASLMCELGIGQLRYQHEGRMRRLFIDGGFAQVHDDEVTVLTERALEPERVTPDVISEIEHAAGDIDSRTIAGIEARGKAHRRASVLRQMTGAR